jgi:hypothetical protein
MLDPNLVTAVWGIAALYGVVTGLLITRADQIYQAYLENGTPVSHQRARTWAMTTLVLPVIALVTIIALSLIAIFGRGGISTTWPPSISFWVVLAGAVTMLIFTAVIFRLVRRVPPFELSAISCEEGADELRSRDSTLSPAKLYWVNEGSAPVQYLWIDRQGNAVERYRKKLDHDGIPRITDTWTGHLWALQDLEGKCIGFYRAREEPGGIIIR